MNRSVKSVFLLLVLLGTEPLFSAPPPAFNWVGTTSSSMSTGSNWLHGSAPASGDTLVIIAPATGYTLLQDFGATFNLTSAATFSGVTPSITVVSSATNSFTINPNGGFGFAVQSGNNGLISFGGGPTVLANTFACPITVPSGCSLLIAGNNGDIFSGVISGAGNVEIGAGAVVLNVANTYGGTTTLSGKVTINATNAIPTGSILALSSSNGVGTMVLNADQAVTINQSVAAGSQVTIGAHHFTVTNTGSSTTWASSIIGGFPSTGSGSGGTFELAAASAGNTLLFSNGNTYSVKTATATFIGNTTLSGGTLQASTPGALAQHSNLSIAADAALDLSPMTVAYSIPFNQISGAGTLALGTSTNANVIFIYSGGTTFSGTITGNASINYSDTSTLTLSNFAGAGYAGPILISGGGTLLVNGLPTATTLSPLTIQTVPGGTLKGSGGFTANNPMTFAVSGVVDTSGGNITLGGVIQGGGGLQKNGSNTLTLSALNSYTGPTTVAAGTLAITNAAVPCLDSATSQFIMNGGTLTTPSGTNALMIGYLHGSGGTFSLGSNTLTIKSGDGPAPAQTTFLGSISGSGAISLGGTLTASTADSLNTSLFSSYTGPLTLGIAGVGSGILTAGSLGTASALNFNFPSGTLHLTNTFSFSNPVAIETTGGTATVATFQTDSGVTLTLSGAITGASTTTLTTTGLGTVILNAANPGFSGAVNVDGGTLRLNNASALLSATKVQVGSTGTLDLNNNSTSVQQLLGLVNPPDPGAQVTLGSGTLTITAGESTAPFYGVISGTGNVVLSGAGTSPTFIGTNTYTGTTTLEGGVLFNTENLGDSSSYIFSGGASGGGILTIGSTCDSSATFSVASATPATVSTNTYNLTLNGDISSDDSTASFIKNGEGTLFLRGTNTGFTGVLILQGGILNIASTDNLGNPANLVSQQFCGTLQMGSNLYTSLTPEWIVATTGIFDTNGYDTTYSGNIVPQAYADLTAAIGGSLYGGLTKTGIGTLTLTGTNTYNGVTTIANGTLIANPTSFPSSVTVLTPPPVPLTKVLSFDAVTGGSAIFKASAPFSSFPQMIFFTSGTINTNSFSITANNIVSGASTSTITKVGSGTLTFSGANIYTGPTLITTGTLQAGVASTSTSGAFGVNSAITVSAGGTLALNGFSNAIGTLAGSGTITLGAGTLTINNVNAASLAFSGTISGSGGGLTISKGTLALTGANTFTGTTTVATGATLSLNNATNTIGAISNAGTLIPFQQVTATTYSQTGTLDLSNITTFPVAGVIDGTGAASLAGTLILPHLKPSSNAVLLSHSSASGTFGTVQNLPNGTTISYEASQTLWDVSGSLACTGTWAHTSAGNWGLTTNWDPSSCAPGVNNSAGTYDDQATFAKLSGQATLTVTMADSAGTAAQDVTLGLLVLGDTQSSTTQYTIQAFGGGTTGTITMGGPADVGPEIYVYQATHTIQAPLALSADTTILSQTADARLNLTGNVSLGAHTLTIQNSFPSPTGQISFSHSIAGTGGLALEGGVLSLSAANSFTGGLAISSGGTLRLQTASAVPSTITFVDTGTILATANLGSLPNIVLTGAGTINTNTRTVAATGIISGAGSLTKLGTNSLTLSGANTYTGATTVTTGILVAGVASTETSGAFGVGSAITVGASGLLTLNDFNNTVGSITGTGSVTLGSATLTISDGGGNTFSGEISGTGGITLLSGTQILGFANSYTGTTTVSGGTLQAGVATTAFGDSSPIVLSGSGVLDLNDLDNTIGSLASTSTASSVLLGSATLTIHLPTSQSFQGVISGTGGIILDAAGTQTLAGANTYTGATTISAGTLQAAVDSTFSGATQDTGAFGVGSTVTVSPGATLALANSNLTTIGTLSGSGAGNVTLGSSSVLTIAAGGSQTFSGAISGNGGLSLSSGTLTLSGSNTYQGPTTVSGGTLRAGSTTAFGSGSDVTVDSGATLAFQTNAVTVGDLTNNGTMTASNVITTTSYTQDAAATLSLTVPSGKIVSSGPLTLSGTLSITSGDISSTVVLQGTSRSGRFTTPPSGYTVQYSAKSVSPATVSVVSSSCTGNWISSSPSAYWSVSGNWDGGCIPGISGSPSQDVATLPTVAQTSIAIALSNGSAAATPLLLAVIFDSADTSYTIQPAPSGTSYINWQLSAEGTPSIDVLSGSHAINANIQGADPSVVGIINLAEGTQLTFGSSCTISNLANLTITDEGGLGTLINNGYITPSAVVIEGNTISNAGWIVTDAGDLTIQGTANLTNTGLLSSFASFTMTAGTVTNQEAILSDTVNISGGTLVNNDLLSTNAFTFSGGVITNSSLITTTSFTKTGSAQLNVQVLNASSFGAITADTATLSGPLSVIALPGFSISEETTLNLITADSVVSQFQSPVFENFPGSLIPSILYPPGFAQLSLVPVAPPHAKTSGTALQFTAIGQHNMVLMRQCLQLRNRFSEGNSNSLQAMNDLVVQAETPVERRDELLSEKIAQQPNAQPWNVYAGPVASFGHVNSKGNDPSAGYYSVGALAGFDYVVDDTEDRPCYLGLGSAIEYRYKSGVEQNNSGAFQVQHLHATIYSAIVPKSIEALAVNILGGFAYDWNDLQRQTGPGQQLTAVGKPKERVIDFLFDVEYTFSHKNYSCLPKNFKIIPLADIQYIYVHINSYQEQGAGIYDLQVAKQSPQSLTSLLGARLNYTFTTPDCNIRLELDGGWQREFLDHNRNVSYVAFNTSSIPSEVLAYGSGRNSALIGLDFLATIYNRVQVEASCDFKWNSLFTDTFFYLGVGGEF